MIRPDERERKKKVKRKLISRRSAKKITSVQLCQKSLGTPPIYVMLTSKDTPWILGKGSSQRARDAGVPVSRIVSRRGVGLVMRWGSRRGGGEGTFRGRSIPLSVEAPSPRASHHALCFRDQSCRNASDLKIAFPPESRALPTFRSHLD